MRLFIALPLSEQVKEDIERWSSPLKSEFPNLKWTSRENLHVTLRFLGDVDPEPVRSFLDDLKTRANTEVSYSLNRTGTFGKPPSVLWLSGIFSSNIFSLAGELALIEDERGETCRRRFIPHITLARVRYGGNLPGLHFRGVIRGLSTQLHLIQSTLTPDGPVYRVLHTL